MSAEAQATEATPVHQMPLVKSEMREVHRALTPDERVEKDHKVYSLKRAILDEEESLKSYTKERKGAIAKLEIERDALIDVGENGHSVFVDVEIRLDVDAGQRIVVEKDTGEIIGREPMKFADRQPDLWPATLEDDAPAVPVSRRVREAFLGTLGDKPGGAAVLNLHNEGLLDPTDSEVEGQREILFRDDEPESAILRDCIADAESDLDEMEATLAQMIADDECSEADLIAIAINSRTVPTSDDAETGAIWDKLLEVRDARAAIDFCDAELRKIPAETVEHDDRSEQLAAGDVVAIAETTEAPARVPVRELRTVPPGERTGRWDVPEYWTAHNAGMLDPDESNLRAARVAWDSTEDVDRLSEDLDALEQDCAAEIKTSAKARMAITRGTWPTKVAKVDDAIGAVRYGRARLEVALDNEAEASAS